MQILGMLINVFCVLQKRETFQIVSVYYIHWIKLYNYSFLELMLFIMFIMEDIFWNDCKWLSKTWIFLLRLVTHE